MNDSRLRDLCSERDIRAVLHAYCRGVDRRDFDLVRSCYHAGATDDHGAYKGDVEGFIAFCSQFVQQFDATMHVLGNITIDLQGDRARTESYAIAHHRLSPSEARPARDHTVAFRYVDDFDRRDGIWRISDRICVYEWTRTDPVPPGWDFTPEFTRGGLMATDPSSRPLGGLHVS